MKHLIFSLILLTFLSSCAIHTGTLSSSLLGPNVKYEDLAIGVSQTRYYFGIGGLSQDALVLEARRELMKNRPLAYNEQYANYTVNFKNSFYFIYVQTKVTVAADVISVVKDSSKQLYSEKYQNKVFGKITPNNLFSIGDSVFDSSFDGGILISLENSTAILLVKSPSNKLVTHKRLVNEIYLKKPSYKNYNLGDKYCFARIDEQDLYGNIMGFGLKNIIIALSDGSSKTVKYLK